VDWSGLYSCTTAGGGSSQTPPVMHSGGTQPRMTIWGACEGGDGLGLLVCNRYF
jgi:hypothetical protein